MRAIIYDVETDNLLLDATRMWCLVGQDLHSGEVTAFTPENIHEAYAFLCQADRLIGHNCIGFDDPVWTSYMDPPLTAVSQPSYTMGILAFEYLLAQISESEKDRKYLEDVILKPSLVIRESCGTSFGKHESHPARERS